jgi:hypothetical protein
MLDMLMLAGEMFSSLAERAMVALAMLSATFLAALAMLLRSIRRGILRARTITVEVTGRPPRAKITLSRDHRHVHAIEVPPEALRRNVIEGSVLEVRGRDDARP